MEKVLLYVFVKKESLQKYIRIFSIWPGSQSREFGTLTLKGWQMCQQKEDRKESLWAFCVLPKMFTMRYPLIGSINLYSVEFRSVEH